MPSIVKARSVVVVPGQSNIQRALNDSRSAAAESGAEVSDADRVRREELMNARIAELEAELAKAKAQAEANTSEQIYDSKIEEALEDAKAIRRQAEDEAASIIAQAQMKSRNITDEAERNGYNMGYNKGLADGENTVLEKAKDSMDEIAYFIEMLQMERMQTCREEEGEILKLAFEVAKKVMRQQIKVDPDAVPRMIEDIVKENETAVKVILSDYNMTLDAKVDRKTRQRIKELLPNIKLVVVPSDGVEETFQIETEDGLIDAAVSGQLERLYEATEDYDNPAEED